MTQLNEHETFASPREYDCPAQIERCSHFNGRILVLGAVRSIPNVRHQHSLRFSSAFTIGITSGFAPCPCGCDMKFTKQASDGPRIHTDSEAEALAAFYAAEAELLGRAL